ncbi:hypothetical protein ISR94_01155 [Candidatus Microgenomates bacterium]|nr:hypothetical protein [Candidatus Microgenomates bacterium]
MSILNKKISVFVLLFVFLVSFSSNAYAKSPKEYHLIPQKTLPGSTSYNLKRVKEKVLMALSLTSKSKFEYGQILVAKRMSELVSIVENKNINQIPNSSQRFAYQAGLLAEAHEKLKDKRMDQVVTQFTNHKKTLSDLRDNYPSNSAHWLYMQQDIDTLDILIDKL